MQNEVEYTCLVFSKNRKAPITLVKDALEHQFNLAIKPLTAKALTLRGAHRNIGAKEDYIFARIAYQSKNLFIIEGYIRNGSLLKEKTFTVEVHLPFLNSDTIVWIISEKEL